MKIRNIVIPFTLLVIVSTPVSARNETQPRVVQMTGDKNAVWIATDDNRLIYCWWPQDPSRLDSQARCRVLDRFSVDRLQ